MGRRIADLPRAFIGWHPSEVAGRIVFAGQTALEGATPTRRGSPADPGAARLAVTEQAIAVQAVTTRVQACARALLDPRVLAMARRLLDVDRSAYDDRARSPSSFGNLFARLGEN